MSLSDTRLILSEEDIKYPVQPILDDPMLTNKAAGVGRGELGEAAQVRAVLNAHGLAQHLMSTFYEDQARYSTPVLPLWQPIHPICTPHPTCLVPVVALLGALEVIVRTLLKVRGKGIVKEEMSFIMERFVIVEGGGQSLLHLQQSAWRCSFGSPSRRW